MASDVGIPAILALIGSAFLLSLTLTPLARWTGLRIGAVDNPSPLGVHQKPTARFGGTAVAVAILAPVVAYALLQREIALTSPSPLAGLLAGVVLVVAIGVIVDTRDISPRVRLAGEVLAGGLAVLLGLRFELPEIWIVALGLPLVYMVVGANALNLLDGLNGMAAGVAALAAVFLGVLALQVESVPSLALACVLAGACVGFLPHNFPRAHVFLGDVGSLSLGFLLGGLAVLLQTTEFHPQVFLASLVILALPVLDTSFAILRRLRARRRPFLGDRRHIYDLLSQRGLGATKAVLVLYAAEAAMGGLAVVIGRMALPSALAAAALAAVVLLSLGFLLGALRPGRARAP